MSLKSMVILLRLISYTQPRIWPYIFSQTPSPWLWHFHWLLSPQHDGSVWVPCPVPYGSTARGKKQTKCTIILWDCGWYENAIIQALNHIKIAKLSRNSDTLNISLLYTQDSDYNEDPVDLNTSQPNRTINWSLLLNFQVWRCGCKHFTSEKSYLCMT